MLCPASGTQYFVKDEDEICSGRTWLSTLNVSSRLSVVLQLPPTSNCSKPHARGPFLGKPKRVHTAEAAKLHVLPSTERARAGIDATTRRRDRLRRRTQRFLDPRPLCPDARVMASWDLAERVIDASSSSCRENLQHALEQPSGTALSPVCQAEVGRVLQDFASSPHAVSCELATLSFFSVIHVVHCNSKSWRCNKYLSISDFLLQSPKDAMKTRLFHIAPRFFLFLLAFCVDTKLRQQGAG